MTEQRRSGFSAVAIYDPEVLRSLIVFAHDPADVEQMMWDTVKDNCQTKMDAYR